MQLLLFEIPNLLNLLNVLNLLNLSLVSRKARKGARAQGNHIWFKQIKYPNLSVNIRILIGIVLTPLNAAPYFPNKKPLVIIDNQGFSLFLVRNSAESEGFEPSKQFPIYTLSKRAPSATRTTLQFCGWQMYMLRSSIRNQSKIFSICMLLEPLIRICAFEIELVLNHSLAVKTSGKNKKSWWISWNCLPTKTTFFQW